MEILYLLVPLSVALVFIIGAVFWWALNNRQFDGLDEVAQRMIGDDDRPDPQAAAPVNDAA